MARHSAMGLLLAFLAFQLNVAESFAPAELLSIRRQSQNLAKEDVLAGLARHAGFLHMAGDFLYLDCEHGKEVQEHELERLRQELSRTRSLLSANIASQLYEKSQVDHHAGVVEQLWTTVGDSRSRCSEQAESVAAQNDVLLKDLATVNALQAAGPSCPASIQLLHNSSSIVWAQGSSKHIAALTSSTSALLLEGLSQQPQARSKLALLGGKDAERQMLQVVITGNSSSTPVVNAMACQDWFIEVKRTASHLREQQGALAETIEAQRQECKKQEEQLQAQLAAARQAQDAASLTLSISMGGASHLQGRSQALERRRAQLQNRLERKSKACSQEEAELEVDLHDVMEVRKALLEQSSTGTSIPTDCKVSSWTIGACSRSCTEPGDQPGTAKATRHPVMQASAGGFTCPSLELSVPCGAEACNEDCTLSDWAEWSACSAPCGGGTMSRARTVTHHGAIASCSTDSALEQHSSCNVAACDVDCTLSDWTPWSECSRPCRFDETSGVGQQSRTKVVAEPTVGEGHCPDQTSAERLERQDCNADVACPTPVSCNSELDLVLALDGSSSANVTAQQDLLAEFVKLLSPAVRLGLVTYGSTARIISPLTADRAALMRSLDASTKPGGDADAVQGLVMSKNLLQASKDGSVPRHQHILLLMGEQPTRPAAATREAKRLEDAGVKLSVALVHATQAEEEQVCAMLPGSCKDKIELIPSWEEVPEVPQQLLVAVCDAMHV
mmetsp:Transcript_47660/g.87608  ORF Transcript_47660/g.87608 Transcript_47660/m.87608 type:complete len:730 (+) Transcript_47660:57-2246(+)